MFARQIATMSNLPSEKKQKSKRKEGIILCIRECASVPKRMRLREFIIGHVANRIIFFYTTEISEARGTCMVWGAIRTLLLLRLITVRVRSMNNLLSHPSSCVYSLLACNCKANSTNGFVDAICALRLRICSICDGIHSNPH